MSFVGKCLERKIYNRLQLAVEEVGGILQMQYGFPKARSMIDTINIVVTTAKNAMQGKVAARKYCAVIILDVKNAFNSAG